MIQHTFSQHRSSTSLSNLLFLFLVIIYSFLYEWAIFEWSEISALVNLIKLFVPFLLFGMVLIYKSSLPRFSPFIMYSSLFVVFLLWGLVPTLFSETPMEGILQWFKFLPRLIFFLSVGIFLLNENRLTLTIAKVFVFFGLFTVIQYMLLLIFSYTSISTETMHLDGVRAILSGPFGLFGNVAARTYMPGFSNPLHRLTGFWLEPSNTAGYLFSMFFLAQALACYYSSSKFKMISYICMIGGFLCLSNAGYFAFGGALIFGLILSKKFSNLFRLKYIILMLLACAFIFAALFGRSYLVENNINSSYMKAILGVRQINFYDIESKLNYDSYGGRIDLAYKNLDLIKDNPFGIGFRIPGQRDDGEGFNSASASAIIFWLAITGVPGIFFLLLMQAVIIYAVWGSHLTPFQVRIAQAWMAMELQNLSYGYWFSPIYFILVIMVFFAGFHRHSTSTS